MKRPTFEHRHYKAIAAIIADVQDVAERERMADYFRDKLYGTNPNYNKDRFERAAKGEPDGRDTVR